MEDIVQTNKKLPKSKLLVTPSPNVGLLGWESYTPNIKPANEIKANINILFFISFIFVTKFVFSTKKNKSSGVNEKIENVTKKPVLKNLVATSSGGKDFAFGKLPCHSFKVRPLYCPLVFGTSVHTVNPAEFSGWEATSPNKTPIGNRAIAIKNKTLRNLFVPF